MLLLALMLAGQQAVVEPSAPQADVVITGNRMRDALDKCLARNCPPEEEVDAAMNAGAESFSAGRYDEAKAILRRAISRNRKYASRMPGPVSDLYATYADVTEHEGDNEAFRHATRESVDVLRDALGRSHPLALRVSARVGDMWVKLGNPDSADSAYRDAAEEAARAGNTDMAAALTFRRAWLALSAKQIERSRRLLDQLELGQGKDPRFARPLRILRARIAVARDGEGGTDELIAALRATQGAQPVLLYEPPYPEFDTDGTPGLTQDGSVDVMASRSAGAREANLAWADIGYWVRPDGRPAEVEILRPSRDGQWAKPLIEHIKARRYVPATQDADGLGAYRVERFTLRPARGVPTGSHIRLRTGAPTLHAIDLTRLAQRDGTAPQP